MGFIYLYHETASSHRPSSVNSAEGHGYGDEQWEESGTGVAELSAKNCTPGCHCILMP